MRIYSDTGEIFLPGTTEPICPALTRARFLASALAQGAAIWVQNEPWCSYRLAPVPVAETQFAIVLQFHAQTLKSVSFVDAHARFGTCWADTTEAQLSQQKAQHDQWLAVWRLRPGRYPWGSIVNAIDPHDHSSSIMITYS